jgi:uncharacterized protein YgiB involved in biofilm formation
MTAILMLLPLVLGACEKPKPAEQPTVYTPDTAGLEHCVADGHERSACDQAIAIAKENDIKVAPRFTAMDQCIASYGMNACTVHHDTSGDWIGPAMLGFAVGAVLAGGGHSYAYGHPVYIDRYGAAVTSYQKNVTINNYAPGSGAGTYAPPPPRVLESYKPAPSLTAARPELADPAKRGGFGASGATAAGRTPLGDKPNPITGAAPAAITAPRGGNAPAAVQQTPKPTPEIRRSEPSGGSGATRGGFGSSSPGASRGGGRK